MQTISIVRIKMLRMIVLNSSGHAANANRNKEKIRNSAAHIQIIAFEMAFRKSLQSGMYQNLAGIWSMNVKSKAQEVYDQFTFCGIVNEFPFSSMG